MEPKLKKKHQCCDWRILVAWIQTSELLAPSFIFSLRSAVELIVGRFPGWKNNQTIQSFVDWTKNEMRSTVIELTALSKTMRTRLRLFRNLLTWAVEVEAGLYTTGSVDTLRVCLSLHLDRNLCCSSSEAAPTMHQIPPVSHFKTQFPIVYRHISATHAIKAPRL